jgi:hypothetical protein
MAILRGFPPSNTISPSVRITEKDVSFVAPEQSFHRAGLVGFASKGPINVPTLVATQRQLNTIFGYPHPESGDPYLIYAAQQYLLLPMNFTLSVLATKSWLVTKPPTTAEVDVPSAGGQIEILSNTAGPYTFNVDSFFRWRLNGVLHSKTLVVLAGTSAATELADSLNDQLILQSTALSSTLTPQTPRLLFARPSPSALTLNLKWFRCKMPSTVVR